MRVDLRIALRERYAVNLRRQGKFEGARCRLHRAAAEVKQHNWHWFPVEPAQPFESRDRTQQNVFESRIQSPWIFSTIIIEEPARLSRGPKIRSSALRRLRFPSA